MTDLGPSLRIAQEAIKEYFLPQVVVVASEQAKKLCARYRLSPAEFLSPFLILDPAKVDEINRGLPRGNPEFWINESINIERIKSIDFEEWSPFEERSFYERFSFYLKRGVPSQQEIEQLDMSSMNDLVKVYGQSTMKEMFRAYLHSLGGEHEFDFFNKCLGVVVLSTNKDELKTLANEVQDKINGPLHSMLGKDAKQPIASMISNLVIFDMAGGQQPSSKKFDIDAEGDYRAAEIGDLFKNLGPNKWCSIEPQKKSFNLMSVTVSLTTHTDTANYSEGSINFNHHLQDKIRLKTLSLNPDDPSYYEPPGELSRTSEINITDAFNDVKVYLFKQFSARMQELWKNSIEKKKSLKKGFFGISLFKKEEPIKTDKEGSTN